MGTLTLTYEDEDGNSARVESQLPAETYILCNDRNKYIFEISARQAVNPNFLKKDPEPGSDDEAFLKKYIEHGETHRTCLDDVLEKHLRISLMVVADKVALKKAPLK